MKTVLPCFYPTTTVLIDDDIDTLENLVRVLDLKKKPHQLFTDPRHGLAHIQADTYYKDFAKNLMHTDEDDLENVLSFHPEVILRELTDTHRYQQVSVMIIDYEMPGMNGVQVCESIDNPFIKKIMLTGVADEKVGIEAFNQGLIYQYVRKQDPHFIEHLHQVIQKAREAYFRDLFDVPLKILQNQMIATALLEPAFKTYFDALVKEHNIEEYYLAEEVGSFLMIDQNQKIHSLITLDEDLVIEYCDSPMNDSLSEDEIKAIEARQLIPCRYDPFHKPNFSSDDLSSSLQKPTIFQGKSNNFYAAFGEGFIAFDADKASFYPS